MKPSTSPARWSCWTAAIACACACLRGGEPTVAEDTPDGEWLFTAFDAMNIPAKRKLEILLALQARVLRELPDGNGETTNET
ncbi:hypothetical protein ACOZ38_21125 [Sphaerisporangium viridialbum]|uniref:hypothetical protein n=1 Tax=Sphaerisporangium viridialbum TaxID=46189 RepID=UPI003C7801F7